MTRGLVDPSNPPQSISHHAVDSNTLISTGLDYRARQVHLRGVGVCYLRGFGLLVGRTLPSHGSGRWFKSSSAHQFPMFMGLFHCSGDSDAYTAPHLLVYFVSETTPLTNN